MSIVLSWILVLGLVSLVVYGNARAGESQAAQKMMSDERARMVGMVVVQMKSLDSAAATSAQIRERMRPLIQQLEGEARTPEDALRIAILAGEALGPTDARTRLSKISGTETNHAAAEDIRSIHTIYDQGAQALSPAAKENLIRRHGYLGRLVLANGIPVDKEPRKTLQTEAFWFTVRLSVLGVGLVVVLVLSLGAFVTACAWFLKGKITSAYTRESFPSGVFLEGFALYLVLFLALEMLLRYVGPLGIQWTWSALLILPAVWLWTRLRGTTAGVRRQAFGWHRGRGVFREIGAGLAGYLAGLVVIAIGILVTLILVRFTGVRASSPIVQELNGGPLRLAGLYAVACIFAPVMEETMFRGIFFHHLRQRWGWGVSAVSVSFIFAMLHPQGLVAAPALSAIALVLAALREWRGSLIAPMAAHACSNFLVLTLALMLLR